MLWIVFRANLMKSSSNSGIAVPSPFVATITSLSDFAKIDVLTGASQQGAAEYQLILS